MQASAVLLRLLRFRPGASTALALVLLLALAARVVLLSSESLIFDEFSYVNAARTILGHPAGLYAGWPAGLDPNQEHPPLGKLLIAASMRVLGDTPAGWRLPSIVAGLAAILLVYAIVRGLSGDPWLGVLAAAIFSADNLVLVHSRIAMLDMPLLALLLLSAWLALRGRPGLSSGAAALAALVKLTGVFGLLATVAYEAAALLLVPAPDRRPKDTLQTIATSIAAFAAVWFLGLWILDLRFSALHTPWDHLHFMLHFGFAYGSAGLARIESPPWQWLINQVQIPYLHLLQPITQGGHTIYAAPVDFRAAMNPFVLAAAPLGLAFAAWRVWRSRCRLALWTLVWFAAMYLPYFPLALAGHRVTYIYYFLPALPAVATGAALLLRRSVLPGALTWLYLALVLAGFLIYFPFR